MSRRKRRLKACPVGARSGPWRAPSYGRAHRRAALPHRRHPAPRLVRPRATIPGITVPTSTGTEALDPARQDRWLIISVVVVGALVVVAAIALAVSLTATSGPTALPASTATRPAPTHAGAAPPSGGSHVKGHHKPAGTSGTPTNTSTTTPVSAAAGGPPVISSLTPSSGSAGQSVQVAGANFLSSSGQIVATFNGQVAPTSCPAQNTCTVTVPPSSGDPSAQVMITTASGTSNAVTFTYG